MKQDKVTGADIDAMTGVSESQKNLMKLFLTANSEEDKRTDKVLVEAIEASDIGHYIEAESLFQEALQLIRSKGNPDDYMFLPILLHYCAFLDRCGRVDEYAVALNEFERVGALYQW